MKPKLSATLLSLAALAACGSYDSTGYTLPPTTPAFTTFQAQGDSLAIADDLDAFRAALGGVLNAPNTPPAASGRREINWDGVPAALTDVDTFPATFFNVNSKRGAEFRTSGTGLRVDSSAFATANAGLGAQFRAFSPKKLFMAVGSTLVEVQFKVVGTPTLGLVNGFGVVFADVDRTGSTRVELYDADGVLIANLTAPAQGGTQGFSFIGAVFPSPIVSHVRIISGDAALNATITDLTAGGTADLVVMDDFVYGEPQPRP
ncbi:MAG TPA: hypothetical protein VLB49_08695 [Gemmatimonadales bacterium]|nr:hypothetical protein [Gemmatimonadales bacterium]